MELFFGNARLAAQARGDEIDEDAVLESILAAEIEASRDEVRLAVVDGIGWNDWGDTD